MSGIIQFQSGFPIRIQTQDDNELISSLFFLGAGAPQLSGPLQILNPKKNGDLYLNPAQFSGPDTRHFRNYSALDLLRSRRKSSGT